MNTKLIGTGIGVAALAVVGLSSIQSAGAQDRTGWPQELRYAAVPTEASKDATQRYAPLIAHLEKTLGLKIKFQNGADYSAVILAQKAKQVELADYGANSYLDAVEQTGNNVEALVIPDNVKGGASYKSIVMVKGDSPIKDVAGAKGKTFAFVDPESTSGYLIPLVYFLKDLKVKPEEYFSKVIFAGTHENAILAVAKGTVEVAASNDQNYQTAIDKGAIKASDVRVIWTSAPIPNGPTAVRKDLPESLRKAIKAAFLSFKDPQALDGFNIKGYLSVDDKDFNPIRDAREVKKSLGK
jgi:phosphonate transport system substrate-binding protein